MSAVQPLSEASAETAPAPVAAPLAAPALSGDVHTISVVSIAHGGSHFCQLMLPPLFPWVAPAFGLSNTQLGLLMSVFFVVSGFGQALAGFVVDRHGAARVLYGGLALLALAALGLGASTSYAMLLVFMALAGLGNCVFHPVDFSILNARVHSARLGQAYAAHGISGSLGWALAPLFLVGIASLASWRVALFAVAAGVGLLLAMVVWQRAAIGDSAVGQRSEKAAAVGHGARADASSPAHVPAVAETPLAFLRLPAVWACFGFFFIFAAALGGLQSFAPAAAARVHGISAEQVAMCLSAYMVCGALGMVLGGRLLRDPRRSALVAGVGFGFAAVVALAIGFGHWPPAWVPVLCGVMGFGSGIAGPSRDLLVKQATPPGATGRVYGVVYSGLDAGLVVSPLLFGMLMDAGWFRAVWLGVALLFTLLIVTALNVKRTGSRGAAALAA